jgi:hypothetical protein
MLELLIAILISLGCIVDKGASAEEIKAKDPVSYQKAQSIADSGTYQRTADGGVVIVTVVGD